MRGSIVIDHPGVLLPALTTALRLRFSSRDLNTYADKFLSAMRKGFGGHAESVPTGE